MQLYPTKIQTNLMEACFSVMTSNDQDRRKMENKGRCKFCFNCRTLGCEWIWDFVGWKWNRVGVKISSHWWGIINGKFLLEVWLCCSWSTQLDFVRPFTKWALHFFSKKNKKKIEFFSVGILFLQILIFPLSCIWIQNPKKTLALVIGLMIYFINLNSKTVIFA